MKIDPNWASWLGQLQPGQRAMLAETLVAQGETPLPPFVGYCGHSKCGLPQFHTAAGDVCPAGHGGAPNLSILPAVAELTAKYERLEDERDALAAKLLATGSTVQLSASGPKVQVMLPDDSEVFIHLEKAEPFVDVFGLMPLFEREAFKENYLFKGPKGIGKTLAVTHKARQDKVPLVVIPCSEDTRKIDLFGSLMAINNETVFVLGGLPLAIEMANKHGRAIIVFEELNALTPQVQKSTNELLDFRQSVTIRQAQKTWRLKPGCEIWAVGTMNPSVYGGTYDINEDLKSRFEEMDFDYPAFEWEKKIIKEAAGAPDGFGPIVDKLIAFASETRTGTIGYALSPRDLVRMLKSMIRLSAPSTKPEPSAIHTELQKTLLKFEGDDKKTVHKSMIRCFPGLPKMKSTWGGKDMDDVS